MKKESIGSFRELPRSKAAWWAIGLGLSAYLFGPITSFSIIGIRPLLDKLSGGCGEAIGIASIVLSAALLVSALVTGIYAYMKGERSWVLWAGYIPIILSGLTWILVIIHVILH